MDAVRAEGWVVFEAAIPGMQGVSRGVCRQDEWDEMEAARRDRHTLLRSGIATEPEAERLARGKAAVPPTPEPMPFGSAP